MYAIIGGSGFVDQEILSEVETKEIDTPFGPTSSVIRLGTLGQTRVAFLMRHGDHHEYLPHQVPSLANIWALKSLGVKGVFAVGTVGGIAPTLVTGRITVPHDFIDYTQGRDCSFAGRLSAVAPHTDMTSPFDERLRQKLILAAQGIGVECDTQGVYACTQGPRLETAAEVRRIRRDGADMIGMTLYPEGALAREIGLPYAGICVSVNKAAGLDDAVKMIDFEGLKPVLNASVRGVIEVIKEAVKD